MKTLNFVSDSRFDGFLIDENTVLPYYTATKQGFTADREYFSFVEIFGIEIDEENLVCKIRDFDGLMNRIESDSAKRSEARKNGAKSTIYGIGETESTFSMDY